MNARVKINSYPDERATNATRLEFVINQGKKIKIKNVTFSGNDNVKPRVLRKKNEGDAPQTPDFQKIQTGA